MVTSQTRWFRAHFERRGIPWSCFRLESLPRNGRLSVLRSDAASQDFQVIVAVSSFLRAQRVAHGRPKANFKSVYSTYRVRGSVEVSRFLSGCEDRPLPNWSLVGSRKRSMLPTTAEHTCSSNFSRSARNGEKLRGATDNHVRSADATGGG